MNITKVNLKDLIHAEYNPRKSLTPADAEYQKIKRSIEEFGYVDPIIINFDNTIIGGHQRATVLKDLGYEEIDAVMVDLDKTKEKALNIALNKISGEWDLDKLAEVMAELEKELDATITGFDEEQIQGLIDQINEIADLDIAEDDFNADAALEEIEEPITKPGDVIILGEHRLLCGDATKQEDYKKLLGGGSPLIDLLVTDPPYNVDYEGKTKDKLKIENDCKSNKEFYSFLLEFYKNACNAMKPGAAFYIWHSTRETVNFTKALEEAGLAYKQTLIWNKNTLVIGRQDYQWKHEPCLYGWKEGAAHYFIDDRTQSTVIEDQQPKFKTMKKAELIELLEGIYADKISTTIINEDKPARSEQHPTMKPIKLLARLIKNSSKPKDKILDPFGGSGSTLIACEQLNRKCYMMELDPKYCDVIVKRWEEYTGQKAKRIN